MKRKRLYFSLAGVVALLLVVLLVPLPHRVICTLEIQPRDATPVYVSVPGRLLAIYVKPDQQIQEGEPLATLENLQIDLDVADLAGQVDHYRRQLENLAFQRHRDPEADAQIPAIREALQTVEGQLARKQEDRQRLDLSAPASGTIFPPPSVPMPRDLEDELPTWSGTPLDRENLGCYLDEGQLFCQVGDPAEMEAVLVIDQAQVEFIREGQFVELSLDALPLRTFTHNLIDGDEVHLAIEEVAKSDLKVSSVRMSAKAGGELATRTDAAGLERPLEASYQARVPLVVPPGSLLPGLRGRAKIHVGSQPLGARIYRWITQTISFRL